MKSMPFLPARFFAFCLGALALPASLHAAAITLDWNQVVWTLGQLSQSFDIDPANPGNDVTVTITDSAGRISQPVSGTTLITGGVSPANKTLQLVANFATNLESISVRIDFNYLAGVREVNFFVHDIDGDLNSWREEVRGISATGDVLPNFAPTQLLAVNASPTFQITGAGLAQLLTASSLSDNNLSNGTASVSFGPQLVRTTGFTYGTSTTGSFDPIDSGISLGTVTYTPNPVPEPSSATLLLSAVSIAGFFRMRVKAAR